MCTYPGTVGNGADTYPSLPVAALPASPTLFPQTAAELSQQCGALKTHVLHQIAQHFLRHPEPVNKVDTSGVALEYSALLDYPVKTSQESEAYLIELRAEGYTFEGPQGEAATDLYEVLAVEELVDVLATLEKAVG